MKCLEEKDGVQTSTFPCNHTYHRKCLSGRRWSCPSCVPYGISEYNGVITITFGGKEFIDTPISLHIIQFGSIVQCGIKVSDLSGLSEIRNVKGTIPSFLRPASNVRYLVENTNNKFGEIVFDVDGNIILYNKDFSERGHGMNWFTWMLRGDEEEDNE